ncbi:uncharacterized protein LOC124544431 [Vanessa cardui]|uniref:uncharacterized protein LOC124544431 n=1 Tax=Vanessa cardui TaxID=171605 RepID=UPI001F12D6CD|nr:uncharacterized protein LOC124544431 [Vanessa cardui]XP_046978938.1 uncharacterized protein LOC124544431 [Vanessa cardui]
MAETVEAGAGLAWRLLATLEGGSLLAVATSALIAYTARLKLTKQKQHKTVNSVLISNTTTSLGRELKCRLESHGCSVSSGTSLPGTDKFDSLIVIGTESEAGLDGLLNLVSQDVNENLNLLETLSVAVRRGGCIAWVCTGEASGAYGGATSAFDTVVRASLQHVAKVSHCEPLWIGRCPTTKLAVDKILAELLPSTKHSPTFSIRNAANKVSVFLGRWLKMVT